MKKLLMLLSIVFLCSCGIDVRTKGTNIKVEGESKHLFGPDFQAWYDYCRGKVEHKNKKKDWNLTEEEILFKTEDCYYSVDVDLPELPDVEDII